MDALARSRFITCPTPSGRRNGSRVAALFLVAGPTAPWPADRDLYPDADRFSADSNPASTNGSVTPAGGVPARPGRGQSTRWRIDKPFSVSKFTWSLATGLRAVSRRGNVGRELSSDATAWNLSAVRPSPRYAPTGEFAPRYSPSRSPVTEGMNNEPNAISRVLDEGSEVG